MSTIPPMVFGWSGEALIPKQPRLADKHYVIGESYRLAPAEERSLASHNQYFASLAEAWANLPEHEAERFPSVTHLRKWALVKAGFADHRSIVCASKAEAQRVAAFVRPMDEYAVVTVSEAVVNVYSAQSQSMKAMGKKAFQDSKTAVLDIAWGLCGVDPQEAAKNVGRAA